MNKKATLLIVILLVVITLPICANAFTSGGDTLNQAASAFISQISDSLPEFSHWKDSQVYARKNLYRLQDLELGYALYEMNLNGKACGYLIIDIKTLKIVEFSSGVSPYRQYLDEYRKIKLAGVAIEQEKLVYSPGIRAIAVTRTGSKETEIIRFMEDTSVIVKVEGISRMSLNASLAASDSTGSGGAVLSVHYKLISGVPDASWYIKCIPTALGNVIGYWDTHGYSNLIVSPDDIYDAISEISDRMIEAVGSNTYNSGIPPAMEGYCHARYPSNFDVTNVSSPAYSTYTYQIGCNRPTLVGFASGGPYGSPGHMTAGVGYYWQDYIEDKYTIVHDAWSPADDCYQLWDSEYNDFIAKIIP
jgi:hypothetical protein